MLQDNDKMKVQYLRSLLFDLFETLQAIRTFAKDFHLISNFVTMVTKSKLLSVIGKTKRPLNKSDVQKVIGNNAL